MANLADQRSFVAGLVKRCCEHSLLTPDAEAHDAEADAAVSRREKIVWSNPKHAWHDLYRKERSARLATVPRKTNFRSERARIAKAGRS